MKLFAFVIASVNNHSKSGVCKNAQALFAAKVKAAGLAVAVAAAKTFSAIKVKGEGKGCVTSTGVAKAQAKALAQIMVEAVTIAASQVPGHNSWAIALVIAKANIISERVASAFALAYTKACANSHQYAGAVQKSVAYAISKPITYAVMLLVAKANCHGTYSGVAGVAGSTSHDKADDHESGHSYGTGVHKDKGLAKSAVTKRCEGKYASCCEKTKICKCYNQCYAFATKPGPYVVWVDVYTKDACHCH